MYPPATSASVPHQPRNRSAAARLRALLTGDEPIRLVGAHNALGAKLAQRIGFDGVWASGLEVSASHGVPDADILTMSDLLAVAQSMAHAVDVPVVADCDTGYGNAINVINTVQRYGAAGIAGVCIEDKLFPKMNSFVAGRQELTSIPEFCGKVEAAKSAQPDPDFVVIARVEALIADRGVPEALDRAYAYAEAGADAILIHEKSRSPASIFEFIGKWDFRKPLVVVPTTYYSVTVDELAAAGVKMVIYANHGLRASIAAISQTFEEILAAGTSTPVESRIATLDLVFDLQGVPELQRNERLYLRHGPPSDQGQRW